MKRIVILGGGFGGIRCALDLSKKLSLEEAEIIIVDKRTYHTFVPALYEVATAYRESPEVSGLKLSKSVSIPYKEIFSGTSVRHLQGEMAFVDVQTRTIYLKHGQEISYDFCVFALGSESNDFGTPGAAQYAHFFKKTEDALGINKKIYSLFESYRQGPQDKTLQFLLIGAGFTGLELAAELAVSLKKLGHKHRLKKKFYSIIVFEAAPQMLPMLKPGERKILTRRLTEIGVGIIEHAPVQEVHPDGLKLADGHVWRGDLMIWTGGIKPPSILEPIQIELSKKKRIVVDEFMKVKNSDSLFALGDSAEYINPKTQQPEPALAHTAIEEAKIVAANIVAQIKGNKPKAYKPQASAWSIPLGGKSALTQINSSLWVSGFIGWLLRLWIDFNYFTTVLSFARALKLFWRETTLFIKNE